MGTSRIGLANVERGVITVYPVGDDSTSATIETSYGEFAITVMHVDSSSTGEVVVLARGLPCEGIPLIRVHSECLTGDVFHSLMCDCRQQLELSLRMIAESGAGALVYLRQEGRGIGLFNKIRAYALQAAGLDTVDANLHLGFPADARDYKMAGQVLARLGITSLRLLTNNPKKIADLEAAGLTVQRVPCVVTENKFNRHYLQTKRERMGHLLPPSESRTS